MHTERENTPLWRDPMSASFLAHRRILLARLRWHERRHAAPAARRRPLRAGQRALRRP